MISNSFQNVGGCRPLKHRRLPHETWVVTATPVFVLGVTFNNVSCSLYLAGGLA